MRVEIVRCMAVSGVLLSLVACSASRPNRGEAPTSGLTAASAYQARMETVADDPGSYLTAHVTNARFVLAPYASVDGSAEHHLVVKEVVDVVQSLAREPENGTIVLEAFDALATSGQAPRWTVRAPGVAGAVYDFRLYKITQAACCDASERSLFFSLANGRELFSSTATVLSVEYAGTREKRYVAFDDGWGSTAPPELDRHSDVIGVLQYGGDAAAAQRVLVKGNREKNFVAESCTILIKGKPVERPEAVLFAYEKQSSFNGFAVSLRLVSRSGDSKATLLVPVTGDRLDIAHAVVHGGIALSEAS